MALHSLLLKSKSNLLYNIRVDITSAEIAANFLRVLLKLELSYFKEVDHTIDRIQILVFEYDTIAP